MTTNHDEQIDLSWLNDFLNSLPETPKRRKNLIEIAGYPHWENVNSNFLAFYLDENEEHGLSRLFIDSLLDLIEAKTGNWFDRDTFSGPYVVEREFSVKTGHRIDILIREDSQSTRQYETNEMEADQLEGEEWAIIIENKLNAELHNELKAYWDGVNKDNKVGVVLGLKSYEESGKLKNEAFDFCGVTHKELVDQVKKNLPDYYMEADDRHLLFLKEYIGQIEAYYRNEENKPAMNEKLQQLHEYSDKIIELNKTQEEILGFLCKPIYEKMEEKGFSPKSWKTAKAMHFYPKEDGFQNYEIAKRFRFWVNIDRLKYNANFKAFFELYGRDDTSYGSDLKDRLEGIFTSQVSRDDGGKDGGTYNHIYCIEFKLEKPFNQESFESQLKKGLDQHFFRHDNDFVGKAIKELKEIIEKG